MGHLVTGTSGFVEQHPLSSLATCAPIEFHISGATSDYLTLSNTHLHIRAKVTKADGTHLDADSTVTKADGTSLNADSMVTKADGTRLNADADVAPVNNWLHALFSQVDVSLNDTLISSRTLTLPSVHRDNIELRQGCQRQSFDQRSVLL